MAKIQATITQLAKGIKIPIGGLQIVQVVPAMPRVRLTGMFFDLNKCFLLPTAIPGIQAIVNTYQSHPNSNMLLVGHTDTSGAVDPNLILSQERADAMAAYLTDQVAPWEDFFQTDKPEAKRWGIREIQSMLSRVPDPASPFYTGAVDGLPGPLTDKAIRDFQSANGLQVDGVAGPNTRQALIAAYMQQDGTSLPQGITPVTVGAGESFPEVETGDGVRNAENRRVEIFFFDGPITPAPPADHKCRQGSQEYPAWLAQVTETQDFTGEDPEAHSGVIFMSLFAEDGVTPLVGKSYTIKSSDGSTTLKGVTDGAGQLLHHGIPNDDYNLVLQGVQESCAALVLLHTADEPQIRFLA